MCRNSTDKTVYVNFSKGYLTHQDTRTMTITVDIPDEVAYQILLNDRDPSRQVLEDVAVEAYRTHRLTEHQLATILGLDRYALDGFLKSREIWLEHNMDDLERERDLGLQLWQQRQGEQDAS